jgi:serine phosphatase RsbU (regulator of sigma subunit)
MQKFVTGVFVDIDQSTGELTLFDMGHSYIYLIKKEKFYKLKTTSSNLPLGVSADPEITGDKLKLDAGDFLILITDGIIEQVNSSGVEFGEKRFSDLIKKQISAGIQAIADKLFTELFNYRGSQPQHDDITITILEYSGKPKP